SGHAKPFGGAGDIAVLLFKDEDDLFPLLLFPDLQTCRLLLRLGFPDTGAVALRSGLERLRPLILLIVVVRKLQLGLAVAQDILGETVQGYGPVVGDYQ